MVSGPSHVKSVHKVFVTIRRDQVKLGRRQTGIGYNLNLNETKISIGSLGRDLGVEEEEGGQEGS